MHERIAEKREDELKLVWKRMMLEVANSTVKWAFVFLCGIRACFMLAQLCYPYRYHDRDVLHVCACTRMSFILGLGLISPCRL
jgi:hypothetical protein